MPRRRPHQPLPPRAAHHEAARHHQAVRRDPAENPQDHGHRPEVLQERRPRRDGEEHLKGGVREPRGGH